MATFVYDGDGRRVKSTINGTTTTFIGAHYEVTRSTVTKYYFAKTQKVATNLLGGEFIPVEFLIPLDSY